MASATKTLPNKSLTISSQSGSLSGDAPPPPHGGKILSLATRRKMSLTGAEGTQSPMNTRQIEVQSPSDANRQNSAHAVFLRQDEEVVSISPNTFSTLTGKTFTSRLIQAKTDRPESPFQGRPSLLAPLEEYVFSLWQKGDNSSSLCLDQKSDGSFGVYAKEAIPAGTLLCELSGVVKKERTQEEGFEHISTQQFAGIASFIAQGFPNCTIVSCFTADKVEHFFLVAADDIEANKELCCNWGRSFQDTLNLPYRESRFDSMIDYFSKIDLPNHTKEHISFFETEKEVVYTNRLERGKELFKRQSELTKLQYLFSQPVALFCLLSRFEESHSSRRRDSSAPPPKPSFSEKAVLKLLDLKTLHLLSIKGSQVHDQILQIASFFNTFPLLSQTSPLIKKGLLAFCREAASNYPVKALFPLFNEIATAAAYDFKENTLLPNPSTLEEKLLNAFGSDSWDLAKPLLQGLLAQYAASTSNKEVVPITGDDDDDD